ncbi:tigger transposable element-derived protein 6-like [Trichogramma pretiosum]|uniref:tigger transposable element-derived protein 6-like n=1 Tax=Trichogramma pretiosum TaxID=7493 RepID=UPI000C71C0A1|nr:tigger transposable element-derived protein 6-like [Trichogramma pretiosum]
MCLPEVDCSGVKVQKNRLTVMLCVNMSGDFEYPLLIGTAKNPHCFKGVNIKSLKFKWEHNKKAWMTQVIMNDFLINFDEKMRNNGRKVILFMDNAGPHPDNLQLTNVKIIFLPPNTTSVSQPLDQGIIKNFKVNYRRRVLKHLLKSIDDNIQDSKPSKITVLDAIQWIISSVKEIKKETVQNCFIKCGFSTEVMLNTAVEAEFAEREDLERLLQPYGVNVESYVSVDHSVPTEDRTIDIPDLIQDALDEDDAADVSLVDQNVNEIEEPSIPYVNLKLAFDYLNGLRHS